VSTQPISFERDVKPLFRDKDREAMSFVFDLWSYDDVSKHADDILRVLKTGYMPCDGNWNPGQVETFRRWATEGRAA